MRFVVGDNFTLSIDEELGEVPRNLYGLVLLLIIELGVSAEVLVHFTGLRSVYICLCEKRELSVI